MHFRFDGGFFNVIGFNGNQLEERQCSQELHSVRKDINQRFTNFVIFPGLRVGPVNPPLLSPAYTERVNYVELTTMTLCMIIFFGSYGEDPDEF